MLIGIISRYHHEIPIEIVELAPLVFEPTVDAKTLNQKIVALIQIFVDIDRELDLENWRYYYRVRRNSVHLIKYFLQRCHHTQFSSEPNIHYVWLREWNLATKNLAHRAYTNRIARNAEGEEIARSRAAMERRREKQEASEREAIILLTQKFSAIS